MIRYFQKGFNYGQDGPGNRLVFHLQGCNMACPWCANPEGLISRGGQTISATALVTEIISCKSLFFDGGGVTFTGGEATLQFEELQKVLVALRQEEIHTAMETNGTHPDLEKLFPLLDLLILDCKQIDSLLHEQVTGLSNQMILNNIKKAAALHPQVWVRIPLIQGFNTTAEDLQRFLTFAKQVLTLQNRNQISFEFLPYHEYGKVKWEVSGKPYTIKDGFVSKETLTSFQQAFQEQNIPLIQT